MTVRDELLAANDVYASEFSKGDLPPGPARRAAILTCMDARLDPAKFLGLQEGDAHVIRNAGGVVTDDQIRSLAISQRLLGTKEIVLIHHTDCGMLTFTDGQFRASIADEVGERPSWPSEAFTDLEANVPESIDRIKASRFVPKKDAK